MTKEQLTEYEQYIKPLLEDEKVKQMEQFIQHGNTTCFKHCEMVARQSAKMAYKYRVKVDMKSLIRGAMLHDYFLYDWHDEKLSNLHGYHHPRIALNNAMKDFELNEIERDIIKKHMFPLTIYLPRYKESILVSLADKYCTLKEFFENLLRKRVANEM